MMSEPASAGTDGRSGSSTLPRLGWIRSHLSTLVLAAVLLASLVLLIYPMLPIFARGAVFGGDWAEYLYSGPSLFTPGAPPLWAYPYPVLPLLYAPVSLGLGTNLVLQAEFADIGGAVALVAVMYGTYLVGSAHSGSKWAGLLAGVVVGGFPLLQSEVGWGGQAQLVAYFLGLLALWLVVSRVAKSGDPRWGFVAGVVLAVGAAAEPYATAFLALTAVLLLAFGAGRRLATGRWLLCLVSLLMPPVVTGGAFILTDAAFLHPTGGPSLYAFWRFAPLYHVLWLDLTAGNAVLGATFVGVGAVYAAYRLTTRSERGGARWLVVSSLLSAVVVGGLLTPAANAERALYPLAFPLAFAAAEMAVAWPRGSPHPSARPARWRHTESGVSALLPIVVVTSLLLTGMEVGTDVRTYPNSLEFYAFDNTNYSSLAFLRGQSGAVLYDGSPASHIWATLWASGRPVYPGPTFQPLYGTSATKQAATILATALSYGEAWIDAGPYTLTVAEPAWGQPAPGVLLFSNGVLTMTIEGNDFMNEVVYAPVANPNATGTSALFYAPAITQVPSATGIATFYNFSGFDVERTLAVVPNGTFLWNYTFSFTTDLPRGAVVHLTSPGRAPTTGAILSAGANDSAAVLSLRYPNDPLPAIFANYTVEARSSAASLVTTYVPSDRYGIFELDYNLTPTSGAVRSFSLSLAIHPHGVGAVAPSVHTESQELAATGIAWAIVSQSTSQLILQRLMDDPSFALYRSTPGLYVLRVV